MSIFNRILTGLIAVIITLAILIPALSLQLIRDHHIDGTIQKLYNLSQPIEELAVTFLERDDLDGLNDLIKREGAQLQTRITMTDPAGAVIADSDNDPRLMENHSNRPEIKQAMDGMVSHSIRYSTTLDKQMLYMARPMRGSDPAVIRLSLPLEDIDLLLDALKGRILRIVLAVALMAVLAALGIAHVISQPLRAISRGVARVAQGDFSYRVDYDRPDELGELADGFNQMSRQLDENFKQITTVKEELESIISSVSEGMMLLDMEGRIKLYNSPLHALTGLKIQDIKNRYHWEVLRNSELNQILKAPHDKRQTCELAIDQRHYLLSMAPCGPMRRIVLLHDISQLKEMEQIKKDLVVNVSHELKTPLTAIKGFVETLIDEQEFNADYLAIIQRHTERLINIVNDLMDLSELEKSGTQLDIEATDIRELIKHLLDSLERKASEKGLKLSLNAPDSLPTLQADPFRLEQLFTNLIDNAIKYTDRGGVSINITSSTDRITVAVSDSGSGIPARHLDRLFERFYVVDKSRSRAVGGTGLGLAIVKHIAGLHRGVVEVESEPGRGTTFRVILPLI